MRVGLVGYGRFGEALADLAIDYGHEVRAFDPGLTVPRERASELAVLAHESDLVVLAVPASATGAAARAILPYVGSSSFVLDVGSVKVEPEAAMAQVFGDRVPFAATHPLFGPVSLSLAETPRRVVVCPNDRHPGAASRAQAFYESLGCEVHVESAEGHDRRMANSHAIAFFVAKGLLDSGADPRDPLAPPSFQALARTIESVRGDAGHLFRAIETENPFAGAARRKLMEALSSIDLALVTRHAEVAIPAAVVDPGARSPELREVRDAIDRIDDELVLLLARRTELARRASAAKHAIGAAVKDESREAKLLAAREESAGRLGLARSDVRDVFEAILRLSRRAQGEPKS